MSLQAQPVDTNQIGYFIIKARPLGGHWREITMFRGAPVLIGSLSTADPFTDSVGQLSLSQVTMFDAPGQGDLDWLRPDTDIDIIWRNTGPYDFQYTWEGFIVSFNFNFDGNDVGMTIDLKGALYALDSYRAKPTFPKRPIPYEILIQRAFDQNRHPARLGNLKVNFPTGWSKKVPAFNTPSYFSFLKPTGVATGQNWTGLTSRSTGAWDPVLTGHVQSMLGVMFHDGNAQWTIKNKGQRRPELYLRRPPRIDSGLVLHLTLGAPGVAVSGTRDFSQAANVIFAQGTDTAGIQYSGMQVSPSGDSTTFIPYAYSPLTYPRTSNPNLSREVMAKETQLKMQDGLDEISAFNVARSQLQRFADPGLTGQITLLTDPFDGSGQPFPRMLIKAGRSILVHNLFGVPEGVMVHVTQSTMDYENMSMSLTFDSKYRDQLTVEEVQARTRDALDPVRALQVGKYQNTVNDLVLPWSYAAGSGIIPSGGGKNAKEFFNEKLPGSATFPYETWTKKYPPKTYPNYYLKIPPVNLTNSTKNWAVRPSPTGLGLAWPIRMAQAGTIKQIQIAAYDKNGNVFPLRFHLSIFSTNGVGPNDTPQFWKNPEAVPKINYLHTPGTNYASGQANPFIQDGWEHITADGTLPDNNVAIFNVTDGSGLVVGWGNYYEPAGYSPGRFSRGASRTGLLTDNAAWSWDLSSVLDLQDPSANKKMEDAGYLFVNIFCDEQGDQPVFFMGRCLRQEPGTA